MVQKVITALWIALVVMFVFYAYAYYLHVTDPYNVPISPIERSK